MSRKTMLELEVLTGPLDGAHLRLEAETEWTRTPGSPLSFPWDADLGEPQARFIPGEGNWQLEPVEAKRGTHILRQDAEDQLPVILQTGDVLKASSTWLTVRAIAE